MVKEHTAQWLQLPLPVDGSYEGQVSIDEKVYGIRLTWHRRQDNRGELLTINLTTKWHTVRERDGYHVNQTPEGGFRCDCPAAVYNRSRDGACKHEQCIAELLEQLVQEFGNLK